MKKKTSWRRKKLQAERQRGPVTFHTKKAAVAAVIFTVAAALALPAAVTALIPMYGFDTFCKAAIGQAITDPGAIRTWYFYHQAYRVLNLLWYAAMAVGMWWTVRSYQGLDYFGKLARIYHKGIRILTVVLIVIYAVKMVLYLPKCMDLNWGPYLLLGLVLMEGAMGVFTYFILRFFQNGLSAATDAADSIFYTHVTGKPEPSGVPGLSYWVMWVLGGFDLFMGVYLPMSGFSSIGMNLSLLLGGLGTVSAGILIRMSKSKMEQAIRAAK
jgi:hypothetical protein